MLKVKDTCLSREQQMSNTVANKSAVVERTSIEIPKTLAERIQKRLSKTDFKTIDDYITYVVEQVLVELEGNEGKEAGQENVFSKEDQESVEQRLRDLGYL